MNDYVVVTTISSFRHRYMMHKDDLRKLNSDVDPSEQELDDWAGDTVLCDECEEFSQQHLGEQILDVYQCSEEEMITFFDRDNDYLRSWERDQKIKWVRDTLHKPKTKEEPTKGEPINEN